MRLEFEASRKDSERVLRRQKRVFFPDWNLPIPRVGETVWLDEDLHELEDGMGEPEWIVTDVWWLPYAKPDEGECVVFILVKDGCS